jgi:hypothetical protein
MPPKAKEPERHRTRVAASRSPQRDAVEVAVQKAREEERKSCAEAAALASEALSRLTCEFDAYRLDTEREASLLREQAARITEEARSAAAIPK